MQLFQVVKLYPDQNLMVIAQVNDVPRALSVVGTGSYKVGEFLWFEGTAESPVLRRATFEETSRLVKEAEV